MTAEKEFELQLEEAHSSLVSARKIAALNDLPEYEKIGTLIDSIEAIFENLEDYDNG